MIVPHKRLAALPPVPRRRAVLAVALATCLFPAGGCLAAQSVPGRPACPVAAGSPPRALAIVASVADRVPALPDERLMLVAGSGDGTPVPAGDLDGLVGFYRMGPHATLRVARTGNALVAWIDGRPLRHLGASPVNLHEATPTAFAVAGHASTRLRFDLGNDGRASVVTVTDGGQTARAVRVAD